MTDVRRLHGVGRGGLAAPGSTVTRNAYCPRAVWCLLVCLHGSHGPFLFAPKAQSGRRFKTAAIAVSDGPVRQASVWGRGCCVCSTPGSRVGDPSPPSARRRLTLLEFPGF